MKQTGIPYLFVRGGTSRGPYFDRAYPSENLETLSKVLVAAVGSSHPLNIDGIGVSATLTTKVAMLPNSEDDWTNIDYFFAQGTVEDGLVDYKPTCSNILSGVGASAIEMTLHEPEDHETMLRIRSVNTVAHIVATVQTPGGELSYEGDTVIDGVPGTSSPVALNFMNVVGSSTAAFQPTGDLREELDDIKVGG